MYRYSTDLIRLTSEVARVLRSNGEAVFVVGNSNLKGVFISNAEALKASARLAGLVTVSETERSLPSKHRYVPPPSSDVGSLTKRMSSETVLRLKHASASQ